MHYESKQYTQPVVVRGTMTSVDPTPDQWRYVTHGSLTLMRNTCCTRTCLFTYLLIGTAVRPHTLPVAVRDTDAVNRYSQWCVYAENAPTGVKRTGVQCFACS